MLGLLSCLLALHVGLLARLYRPRGAVLFAENFCEREQKLEIQRAIGAGRPLIKAVRNLWSAWFIQARQRPGLKCRPAWVHAGRSYSRTPRDTACVVLCG